MNSKNSNKLQYYLNLSKINIMHSLDYVRQAKTINCGDNGTTISTKQEIIDIAKQILKELHSTDLMTKVYVKETVKELIRELIDDDTLIDEVIRRGLTENELS